MNSINSPLGQKQDAGFIYLLDNQSMPGIVKIGCSKHPRKRCEELSSATGVATPFNIVFIQFLFDMQGIEALFHKMLKRYRVSASREFFRVSPGFAIEMFSDYLMKDGLVPVEGQDFIYREEGIEILHDKPFPLEGQKNDDMSPCILWLLTYHRDYFVQKAS